MIQHTISATYLMRIYGDLMGIYGDLLGIYGDLMGYEWDVPSGND